MLIICDDEERDIIRHNCGGECERCVFRDMYCPVEYNMIITDMEIARGKDMKLRYY